MIRTRPGPKRALDLQMILDAAFDLLRNGGERALSIRGVASKLGLTPNALYTYVPSKASLVGEMVEYLYSTVDTSALSAPSALSALSALSRPERTGGERWDPLRAVALSMRDVMGLRSRAAGLVMSGPVGGPKSLALNELILAELTAQGLSLNDAARASYTIQVYVLGFVALDIAEVAPGAPPMSEAARTEARWKELSAYDVADFPLAAQTGQVVAGYNSTEQFLWGLDQLLGGLERGVQVARPGA